MSSSSVLKTLSPPHHNGQSVSTATAALEAFQLSGKEETETLAFLAKRPLYTVIMSGLIRDNGLINSLNRGVFYACRDEHGQLAGVALIGHAVYVETRAQAAIEAFARLVQTAAAAGTQQIPHMILGESEQVARLWQCCAEAGGRVRRACREVLLEQRWPIAMRDIMRGLRPAILDELPCVMTAQAAMAFEESGVDPLEVDPLGFRLRCARRIEQNRVWVLIEDEQLIFKADVISDTPEVVYLEGVYVAPEKRGKGYGLRCLSQLNRGLLARAQSVCLLVNESNQPALDFYARAGFKQRGYLSTIFFQRT